MRRIAEVLVGPSIDELKAELKLSQEERRAIPIRLRNLGGHQYTNRMVVTELRSIDEVLPVCFWVVFRRQGDGAVYSGVLNDKNWTGWIAPGPVYKKDLLWLLGLDKDVEKLFLRAGYSSLERILNSDALTLSQVLVKPGEPLRLGQEMLIAKIVKRMTSLQRRLKSLGIEGELVSFERYRLMAILETKL